ncbi:hypothetical protein ACFFU8_08930 [Chromobacterium piscinae]|uniref:hypothetical protein n=1 Tax=Chromobacterium piscinae TaxID=686831 RepID=UPI001E2F9B52|nr:hypothetical protein [Chromobacterium piscinae]MCD5327972.1 hypothetical protein [Chromobacterium piscinae]
MNESEKIYELNEEIKRLAQRSYFSSYAGYGSLAMGLIGGAIAWLVISKSGNTDVLASFKTVHIPEPIMQALSKLPAETGETTHTMEDAGIGSLPFEPSIVKLAGVFNSKAFLVFGVFPMLMVSGLAMLFSEDGLLKVLGRLGVTAGFLAGSAFILVSITVPSSISPSSTPQERIESALADGDWATAKKVLVPLASPIQQAYLQAQVDYLENKAKALQVDLAPLKSLPSASVAWADNGHLYAMERRAFGKPVSAAAKEHVQAASHEQVERDNSLTNVSISATLLLLVGGGLVAFGHMLRQRVSRLTNMARTLGFYTVKARIATDAFKPAEQSQVPPAAASNSTPSPANALPSGFQSVHGGNQAHRVCPPSPNNDSPPVNTDLLSTALVINALSRDEESRPSAVELQCSPDFEPAPDSWSVCDSGGDDSSSSCD